MNMKITIITIMLAAANLNCQARQVCCPAKIACMEAEKTSISAAAEILKPDDTSTLKGVLEKLRQQTSTLTSFAADIEYLFIDDPMMVDSRTLQKGKFYFQKDKKRSRIRINFDKRKQDDEDEYKRIDQIIFDGVWLIRIDHELKTIVYDQQAEKDKPIEAFEFISRNFPMIGFTKTEKLEKNFEIKMLKNDNDPNTPIHLRLKPKPESKYAKEYSRINFWIDKKSFLPSRLVTTEFAETEGEGNIYDIKLKAIKANKKIEKAVFKVETPAGFTEDRRVLRENPKS